MAHPLAVAAAINYLTGATGETVEREGLGMWRVNGELSTEEELIAYANDLRKIDGLPLLEDN